MIANFLANIEISEKKININKFDDLCDVEGMEILTESKK